MRLQVEVPVDAPRAVVWDVLTDWERQSEWMVDAVAVEVLTPHREGEGVTVRCPTRLLGITVEDVMRVTRWEEPRRLEVTHLGRVIRGTGGFELDEDPTTGGTVLSWWERIDPPLGAIGAWGTSTLVLPVLERIFRRSLNGLAQAAEQAARRR